MYTIQTYNAISPFGLALYPDSKYKIIGKEDKEGPDAIMVHSAPLHELEFAPNLKAIVRVGAGVNTIPVDRCTENGIVVFNTPGGNANAVKELCISVMIMAIRNVIPASDWVMTLKGQGSEPGKAVEKGKEVFRGPEIMGKRLGIIGIGSIGSRMAQACSALGMTCVGYDPYLMPHRVEELAQYVTMVDSVDEIYKTCDYITIHVPLNDETRDYIDTAAVEKMRDGVVLLNYARGPIVNSDAVVAAVKSGKISRFCTDFPTDDQLGTEHIFCTPHLGAGTPEADQNCAVMASRQIMDYLENGNIKNSVNLPDVAFPRNGVARVAIIHKNVRGMLSILTDAISDAGINIADLVNKSRGDVAYTLLDLDDDAPQEVLDKFSAMPNVIKVFLYK